MDYELQFKIYNDKKMAKYLREHSQWYKYLNRSSTYYKQFLSDYKKHNRDVQASKVNGALDTLDTVNTILKIIN